MALIVSFSVVGGLLVSWMIGEAVLHAMAIGRCPYCRRWPRQLVEVGSGLLPGWEWRLGTRMVFYIEGLACARCGLIEQAKRDHERIGGDSVTYPA